MKCYSQQVENECNNPACMHTPTHITHTGELTDTVLLTSGNVTVHMMVIRGSGHYTTFSCKNIHYTATDSAFQVSYYNGRTNQ